MVARGYSKADGPTVVDAEYYKAFWLGALCVEYRISTPTEQALIVEALSERGYKNIQDACTNQKKLNKDSLVNKK